MDDALPASVLEDWQAEMLTRLGRIETQVKRTNGRVSGLEDRMDVADRERSTLAAELKVIRSQAVPEIERVVRHVIGDELDRRETVANAAKLKALEGRFGQDIEDDLARMSRIKRLGVTSVSRLWYIGLGGLGSGLVVVLGRLLT